MNHSSMSRQHRKTTRRKAMPGFTLIEAALTMVIVGVGVLAMVSAQQAYHMKNDWANRTGTAQMLANEVREMTLSLPHHDPISGSATLGVEANETGGVTDWDDLDDFAGAVNGSGVGSGVTFSPPINALASPIDDLAHWRQVVRVTNVLPDDITVGGVPLGSTDMMRVTVTVGYKPGSQSVHEDITSMTWVVSR